MTPRLLKGYASELNKRVPKACAEGHNYVWSPVEPVIGTRPSYFVLCRRCKHVKGTNFHLVKKCATWAAKVPAS